MVCINEMYQIVQFNELWFVRIKFILLYYLDSVIMSNPNNEVLIFENFQKLQLGHFERMVLACMTSIDRFLPKFREMNDVTNAMMTLTLIFLNLPHIT